MRAKNTSLTQKIFRDSRYAKQIVFILIVFLLFVILLKKSDVSDIRDRFKYWRILSSNVDRVSSNVDQGLIDEIKEHYLVEPSSGPYNLEAPDLENPSRGQASMILDILSEQRNGFYVECGALDGETRSNTLYMERKLGWKGLLVEADPKNFKLLLRKNRHAWSINVCLNDKTTKSQVVFKPQFNVGQINRDLTGKVVSSKNGELKSKTDGVVVDCFPLHAILLAMNVTKVDYFSLDVEGAELEVLHSIPFDLIDIRTLSVEYIHTFGAGKEGLRDFMKSKGYIVVGEVTQPDWTANDFIFVKKSHFPNLTEKLV